MVGLASCEPDTEILGELMIVDKAISGTDCIERAYGYDTNQNGTLNYNEVVRRETICN